MHLVEVSAIIESVRLRQARGMLWEIPVRLGCSLESGRGQARDTSVSVNVLRRICESGLRRACVKRLIYATRLGARGRRSGVMPHYILHTRLDVGLANEMCIPVS